MTLLEFLETDHGYDELIARDKNGKFLGWIGDDDEKYSANVLCVTTWSKNDCVGVVYLDCVDEDE